MRTLKVALWCAVLGATSGCASTQRPDGGAGLLQSGATVSPLRGIDQAGRTVALSFPADHWTVVYFYPKDATPGCTKEACAFRDVWRRYEENGVRVYGVSNNDVASHAEFAREHQLPFPLIADVDEVWARTFGVPSTLGFYSRVTFLIDPNGQVLKTYEDVDAGLHAREILRDLAALQSSSNASSPTASGEHRLAPAPRLTDDAAEPSVRLELRAGTSPGDANPREFWLAAELTPPSGAHLSWKHAGPAGLPTSLRFFGPRGFDIEPPLYPGPTRFESAAGGVTLGYAGSFVVLARVTSAHTNDLSPASRKDLLPQFQVHGTWLSCDTRCVKEEAVQSVTWSNDTASLPELPKWLAKVPSAGGGAGFRAEGSPAEGLVTIHVPPDWHVVDAFAERETSPGQAPPRVQSRRGLALLKYSPDAFPRALTLLANSIENGERFFSVNVEGAP